VEMVGLKAAGGFTRDLALSKSAIFRYCGVGVKDRRTVELERENEELRSRLGELAAENRKLKWTLHALHEEPSATRTPWLENRCPICAPPGAMPLKFALTPHLRSADTPLLAPEPQPVACHAHASDRPVVPPIPLAAGRAETVGAMCIHSGRESSAGCIHSGREPLRQISNHTLTGKDDMVEGDVKAVLSDISHHADALLAGPPPQVGPQTLQTWRSARDCMEESLRARLPDESARSLALDMAMSPGRSTARSSLAGNSSSHPVYSIESAFSPGQSPERSPWRPNRRSPHLLEESPRYFNLDGEN
jgi:hypothetical protein